MGKRDFMGTVEQAKKALTKSQENLFEAYVTQLRSTYLLLNAEQRQRILGALERVVNLAPSEEHKNIGEGTSSHIVRRTLASESFDYQQALRIRIGRYQSASDFLRLLGENNNSTQQALLKYERGERKRPRANSPFVQKYFQWLNRQGYSPKLPVYSKAEMKHLKDGKK